MDGLMGTEEMHASDADMPVVAYLKNLCICCGRRGSSARIFEDIITLEDVEA